MPGHYPDPTLGGVLILLFAVVVSLYRGIDDWRTPDEGTIEHAHALYTSGEIDHAELERRLDVIQDPEADRIRQAAERVSGIGEQTAWDLAAEFRSLEAVRDADQERLEQVPNIGEERAAAIQRHL